MAPKSKKRLSSSKKQRKLPTTQAVLDHISAAEAQALGEEIIETHCYSDLINTRHLPSELTINQLKCLRSITHHDGKEVSFARKYFLCCFFRNIFYKLDGM
jgi:hypothetical protein